MSDPIFVEQEVMVGSSQTIVCEAAFGATRGHVHHEHAGAVGSDIPAGVFVSYSPQYMQDLDGCVDNGIILPDLTGEHLTHADGTSFEETIAGALCADVFKFVGVTTYAGDTCKHHCQTPQCCPFNHGGDQWNNYWPRFGLGMSQADIVTQGKVKVKNITDVALCDELHVVTGMIEGEPCRQLGAITNVADAGTQPLDIDYRIVEAVRAGCGVWIELGRS